ncbi:hypothetical protein GCM10022261_00020 [Brevibacterium daeguense]|uniref:Hemolysin type calcium-binding protein n=1 Tax=Brevibacterium daeguense TaxID=909936 RepID=A0ABP8EEW3_9MICO
MSRSDVWDLEATAGTIIDHLRKWRAAREAFASVGSSVTSKVTSTQHGWDDSHAESFFAYAPMLADALNRGVEHCSAAITALENAETAISTAQGRLDALLSRVPAGVSVARGSGAVTFTYPDPPEGETDAATIAAIDGLVADARPITDEADDAVSAAAGALKSVAALTDGDANQWSAIALTGAPKWKHPDYGTSAVPVIIDLGDGRYAVAGTNAGEYYRITTDPETGELVLTIYQLRSEPHEKTNSDGDPYTVHVESIDETVEPEIHRFPAGTDLVVNTGGGNDRLDVPPGTDLSIRVFGGTGADTINTRGTDQAAQTFGGAGNDYIESGAGADHIFGGSGDDYVDAGAGDDRLHGGTGHDYMYGTDGRDFLWGGEGRDYLDGGSGNDHLFGGSGADQLQGGRDDDAVYGGDGDDVLYGGHGTDSIDGGAGANTAYSGKDDAVTGANHVIVEYNPDLGQDIVIEGSPEFIARVQSDLEHMRSSPAGQQQMANVDQNLDDSDGFPLIDWNGRDTFVIREYTGEFHEGFADGDATWDDQNSTGGYQNRGVGGREYVINYNPRITFIDPDPSDWDQNTTPPFVVFYHEFGHVNQYSSGSVPDGKYDQDGDGKAETKNLERQNVGLPWDYTGGGFLGNGPDGTEDPTQDEESGWDYDYTENGIRDELGLDRRTQY